MLEFLSRPFTIGGWIAFQAFCVVLACLLKRHRRPRLGYIDDLMQCAFYAIAEGEKQRVKDRETEILNAMGHEKIFN